MRPYYLVLESFVVALISVLRMPSKHSIYIHIRYQEGGEKQKSIILHTSAVVPLLLHDRWKVEYPTYSNKTI